MRSAIYYPQTQVRSEKIMKSSLLLWDRLHTIVPFAEYAPDFGEKRSMSEAWELIGKQEVPDTVEKTLAHRSLKETLRKQPPEELRYLSGADGRYEVWPQKFLDETWRLLRRHRMTDDPLENADYPMTREGGVMIMAKLADAMAGEAFARVTDNALAFGCTSEPVGASSAETVLMTLDLIDARQIPLSKLISFRKRELRERRGYDYTAMRHRYADAVRDHLDETAKLKTALQRHKKNEEFNEDMKKNLRELNEALTGNRMELILKPVIVATVTGVTLATAGAATPMAVIAAGTAALGASATDVAEKLAEAFRGWIRL